MPLAPSLARLAAPVSLVHIELAQPTLARSGQLRSHAIQKARQLKLRAWEQQTLHTLFKCANFNINLKSVKGITTWVNDLSMHSKVRTFQCRVNRLP
jgi:hypothetical protein